MHNEYEWEPIFDAEDRDVTDAEPDEATTFRWLNDWGSEWLDEGSNPTGGQASPDLD